MTKKIISALLMITMLTPFGAHAEEKNISAYTSKTENVILKIEAKVNDGEYPIVLYLPDNTLFSAHTVNVEDGVADVSIPCPDSDYLLKLYNSIGEDTYFSLNSASVGYLKAEAPEQDIKPEDTVKPEDDIKKPENENPSSDEEITDGTEYKLPGVYESEYVANGAFAVVKKADQEVNEAGEIVTIIKAYYQGREINVELEEDFTLGCSEEGLEMYDGMYAHELEEGDIIIFHCNLSGKVLRADLLFKVPKTNIVTDDEYDILFKDKLTEYSCGFGLIVHDYDNKAITMYDSSGLESKSFYFDLDPETVVYYYDMDKRSDRLSIATVNYIQKSAIPSADFDEDDNIINWDKDTIYNYAYARVHDELICDVVIYANYKE